MQKLHVQLCTEQGTERMSAVNQPEGIYYIIWDGGDGLIMAASSMIHAWQSITKEMCPSCRRNHERRNAMLHGCFPATPVHSLSSRGRTSPPPVVCLAFMRLLVVLQYSGGGGLADTAIGTSVASTHSYCNLTAAVVQAHAATAAGGT